MKQNNFKILIIDDDVNDIEFVKKELSQSKKKFEITESYDFKSAFNCLRSTDFDCVLIDYQLPDGNAFEVMGEFRECVGRLPFILLTARDDESLLEHAFQNGIQDYLKKGHFDGNTLERSILYSIERSKILDEMEESKRSAEYSERIKTNFLSNISHEIRTPLNGIIGFTGLLLDSNLDEEQRELVETIQSSGDTLLALVNDILDFSNMDEGKLTVEPIPFDLRVSVEEVSELLIAKAEKKGVELVVRYLPNAPRHVIGDPGRIRQILSHFIDNAIKFTDEGYVCITVLQDKEGWFNFTVEDTGIGLPQEHADKIFDTFTQADGSLTRKFGGTGLGLAICKKLTDLMGGEISAQNRLGGGAVFNFKLKLEVHTPSTNDPLPLGDISNLKVLIVDDNEVICQVLQEQISAWGMNCAVCTDPRKVVDKLKATKKTEEPFHICVIDCHMPHMDGDELGQIIKSDPEIKDTILIMHTSQTDRGHAKHFERIGFAAYLLKPIQRSQLMDTFCLAWGLYQKNLEAPILTRHTVKEQREARKGLIVDNENLLQKIVYRVLVVEDNLVNQKVIKKLLKRMDCRMDVAANGVEALDLLKNLTYDLILMDIQMPEMDGFECTKKIREFPDREKADIPIVAMTARVLADNREECLSAGMNDYVTKPLRFDEIEKVLSKYLFHSQ